MKDKIIILAAGEGTRWNNYLGTPKHLLKIDDETLLERTTRLFKGCDIVIVGRDDRYKVEGSTLHIPKEIGLHDINRQTFYSQDLWSKEGRTIIVLGDVFFTEEAVKTIRGYEGDDIRFYGRHKEGKINKCPWGELFAVSFLPNHHDEIIACLHKASKILKHNGMLNNWWEFYRYLDGIDPMVDEIGDRFVEINDWTDDFDNPENYVIWSHYYKKRNDNRRNNSK